MKNFMRNFIFMSFSSEASFISTALIVAKQLHGDKQENNSINVEKFISYEIKDNLCLIIKCVLAIIKKIVKYNIAKSLKVLLSESPPR